MAPKTKAEYLRVSQALEKLEKFKQILDNHTRDPEDIVTIDIVLEVVYSLINPAIEYLTDRKQEL